MEKTVDFLIRISGTALVVLVSYIIIETWHESHRDKKLENEIRRAEIVEKELKDKPVYLEYLKAQR